MKILLDENFPSGSWAILTKQFHKCDFGRVGIQIPKGVLDLELFSLAQEHGYNAIITSDIKQINNTQERQACKNAQLHWIGIPRNLHLHGRSIVHGQIAQLLFSMNPIIKSIETAIEPTAFLLSAQPAKPSFEKGFPQNL